MINAMLVIKKIRMYIWKYLLTSRYSKYIYLGVGNVERKEKFYKKEWFMWLMLLLITPIGLVLLLVNKKYAAKTKWIVAGVFSVWFIIMSIVSQPTEEEKAEEAAKQEQFEKEKEQKKANEKAASEKKKEEEKKEKERKANRSIDEIIEEDSNHVDEAMLEEGELTLRFEPGTLWDENSLMRVAHDMFQEVKKAFDDDTVDSVLVMIETTMTDEKGNESLDPVITYRYTRHDFEELNYDNFLKMSVAEEWRVLNEADSYYIHPGIRKNLKDKYLQNLK